MAHFMKRPCKLLQLGSIDYQTAWRYQKALSDYINSQRRNGKSPCDYVLVLNHEPSVYTIGRGGLTSNIKFNYNQSEPHHQVYRIERGGDVTWHGKGQLVSYPILDLNHHKRDLHWCIRSLEETVILALEKFGIQGTRSDVNSGVWYKKNKISAVGLTASRWITMHGVAVNIDCDLSYFQNIIPCGISNTEYGVCSISSVRSLSDNQSSKESPINETTFQYEWLKAFEAVYNVDLISPMAELATIGSDDSIELKYMNKVDLRHFDGFASTLENNTETSNSYAKKILNLYPSIGLSNLTLPL